ncbi:hypothetical protein K0817_003315 [Microbacterium sp. HD4P20]|uniref:hypothetical protein n=1 Tax=Microbacterium sp. HD4P20 TaxID=2864874 RepID=UPI001C63ECBA|nr:hypothetical protein [Microbacterium sp. HD4P20]MCP2635592.1 hypothetical protein [Microbacterium sp. HD4P20]
MSTEPLASARMRAHRTSVAERLVGPFGAFLLLFVGVLMLGVMAAAMGQDNLGKGMFLAVHAIGEFVGPTLPYALAVIGLVATLLIPIAAFTAFGSEQHRLDEAVRAALRIVVLVLQFILAAMCAVFVPIGLSSPRDIPMIIATLVLAWSTATAAGLTFSPPRSGAAQRVKSLENRLDAGERRATRVLGSAWRNRVVSRTTGRYIALWLTPVLTWGGGAVVIMCFADARLILHPTALALVILPCLLDTYLTFAWYAARNKAELSWAPRVAAVSLGVLGAAGMGSLAIVLAPHGHPWNTLSVYVVLFTLAHAAILFLPARVGLHPGIRRLEASTTAKHLRRIEEDLILAQEQARYEAGDPSGWWRSMLQLTRRAR